MQGIIIKGIAGFYYVKTTEGIIECKARGKFRHNELTPMVGDNVEIDVSNGKGVIDKIYKRSSELQRPNVSNITQAFIVFAIKDPKINLDLLNKLLVLCESNNIKPIVCFNKCDLEMEEENNIIEILKKANYQVLTMEATGESELSEIKTKLKDNISVLCGPSGVGKSTIINKLLGEYLMETGEISNRLQRGKHTTRHSQLFEVGEGFLVDTPGFSVLDISFIPKTELQLYFPEFKEYMYECKYRGCIHHKEPNCAVKKAVENNEISLIRYNFYIQQIDEIENRRLVYD